MLLAADVVGGPGFDAALGPLLLRRGLGEARDILRVYSPEPTAAFSRRDTLRTGYERAAAAARSAGFTPVVRPQGGSLAVQHPGSVIIDHVHRSGPQPPDPTARFQHFAAMHAAMLRALGVDAHIGPVPGEYCPGDYSINDGRAKLVGSAQRVTRDGWLFSTVIQVTGSALLREALLPAYAALGYEFDPATVGAIADTVPAATVRSVTAAVLSAYGATAPGVPLPEPLRAELPHLLTSMD
ncbi:lipoate-protein ligase A [Actinoplanes octamycinicus]|uniref:Lipoate-protein ligase A n=1 Tax=Actinoplanes octamycinicus TaxID=135948 RepID=A0A7W7MAM4_9ACTN|nr:lipoate-protein ligase A [Actinoplanes octamycinicus]